MIIKPIPLTIWSFMLLRRVRNECRLFMTSYQAEITGMEQYRFYQRYRRSTDMMGFLGYKNGAVVAYGLLNRKGDDWWLSGGVRTTERGKGYGRQMFSHLTTAALAIGGDAHLDVLKSNTAAIHLYESLGFEMERERFTPYGLAIVMSHSG